MGKKKEQINPMNEFFKTLDDKAKHWAKLLLDKEDLIDVDYRSKEYETEWDFTQILYKDDIIEFWKQYGDSYYINRPDGTGCYEFSCLYKCACYRFIFDSER